MPMGLSWQHHLKPKDKIGEPFDERKWRRLRDVAVIRETAVEQDLVFGVDFDGLYRRSLGVFILDPALAAVPPLADDFAVFERHLRVHREYRFAVAHELDYDVVALPLASLLALFYDVVRLFLVDGNPFAAF